MYGAIARLVALGLILGLTAGTLQTKELAYVGAAGVIAFVWAIVEFFSWCGRAERP